MKQKRQRI